MGNPKQKWTCEEEEALRAGVLKHGPGKWKNIQKDPQFNHLLFSRSNIDLKDKWRNMSVANGQNPREKSRIFKPKTNPDAPATSLLAGQSSAFTDIAEHDAPTDAATDDSMKCTLDVKSAAEYNDLIFEALATIQDPNGSDTSSIANFIMERHDVPPNFRRVLTSRLRRLVAQGKLQKTMSGYRIPGDVMPDVKEPTPEPKPIIHYPQRSPQISSNYLGDTLEEVAVSAAYRIADAENKSFVAAESVKEADRVAELAEEAEALLQLAKDIYERCCRGEIVTIA